MGAKIRANISDAKGIGSDRNGDILIEVKHLKKSFGNNEVFKDFSLALEKKENLVVLGKSGSGKSVLIKCMVGLIDADEGEILVMGEDIEKLNEKALNVLRKKIGFLFQSAALYDSMTVGENLAFPLRGNKELSDEERNALVEESLENVGLKDVIDKMPSELSGGMRKRIGLARTLILKPEIVLYDEPTTGLDPITAKEISELILEIREKYQTSSIIITHDLACAKIVSDRIVIIHEGVCAAIGTYETLQNSEDKWVRSFFE
ncbi:MAG: ATP-binding cassette domain-containing protein [bacterium]|nr:ATP-binding cassette domain-containing protein [bacterium]